MLILVKPELENTIVLSDVKMVMENFGIGSVEPSPAKQDESGTKWKMKFEILNDEAKSILYDIAKFS